MSLIDKVLTTYSMAPPPSNERLLEIAIQDGTLLRTICIMVITIFAAVFAISFTIYNISRKNKSKNINIFRIAAIFSFVVIFISTLILIIGTIY